MDNKIKKFMSNTVLLAIGSFSSHLITFIFLPIYTSIFSQNDFGVADLIFTTTSLLYPFTTAAIGDAVMRFSLDKGNDVKYTYSIGLSISIIGFIILLFFLPILNQTVIGPYSGLFLIYYFIYCFKSITAYFIRGLEKVFFFSFSGILSSVVLVVCNIIFLLWLDLGIKGYLLAYIISSSTSALFLLIASKTYKYFLPPWKIDFSLTKKMLRFSLPIVPNSISWWISNSLDRYMLSFFSGMSFLGMYAVAQKIPSIMTTLMAFVISSWELSAVENFGSDESKKMFSVVYDKYFTATLLASTCLVVFSKPLAFFLYKGTFFEAWKYSSMLIFANVFYLLSAFFGTIYTSGKKTSILSISTTVASASNIVLNFLLIPYFNTTGAIIATIISYVIVFAIRIINTKRIIDFHINAKRDLIIISIFTLIVVLTLIDTIFTHIVSCCLLIGLFIYFKNFFVSMICLTKHYLQSVFKKNKAVSK